MKIATVVRTGIVVLLALAGISRQATAQTLPPERHPGLLFTAEQVPLLRERIQRSPYSDWWQIVLQRAQSTPATLAVERSKARYAKSLAFAYLMTDDRAFADRAVELLKDVKFPPRGGDLGQPHNEGEIVGFYAQAYDMIHNFVQNDPNSLEEIRTILAEEAERLRKGIVIQEVNLGFTTLKLRLHETGLYNNWHLRAYSGLGMAALVLADHPGIGGKSPQDWADQAFTWVDSTLTFQIEETDGGYAEGPFYARYAADVYLPYMFALKNLQGIDFFNDTRVRKMHDWSVNIRLPNGRRPNIDDGHIDDFYGHYLAAVDDDGPVHLWDWENNSNGLYVREFSEADAIAFYDDGISPREPRRGPTIFMPGAGDAAFRSDWSATATYMLLRGEHGKSRNRGFSHEHPDETSFIIHSGGEMLALDAGYINFENHHKVNQGRNHNVVLVDGRGPPLHVEPLLGQAIGGGNNAYIEEYFNSSFMDYAEVRAEYQNVDVRRHVMFAYKDYFIIADELRDASGHLYEWRLHGNGGGSSGGSYTRSGNLARWTRPRAELLAYLSATKDYTFSERDTLHSFDYLEESTHTLLRVQQTGEDAEFLAVLYPRALDEIEPVFTSPGGKGGQTVQIDRGGTSDLAWVSATSVDTVELAGPFGALSSDGNFCFVRFDEEDLRSFNVQNGSFLLDGTDIVFAASDPVDVSLETLSGGVEGFVRGPDAGYQLSIPLNGRVETLSFEGSLLDSSSEFGALTLDLAGEGILSLQVVQEGDSRPGRPTVVTSGVGSDLRILIQRADFDGSGVVDFEDFFRFADAFGQSAEGRLEPFDLDDNGVVDLGDFFRFADVFGQTTGE